jgi:transposase InsO family protein
MGSLLERGAPAIDGDLVGPVMNWWKAVLEALFSIHKSVGLGIEAIYPKPKPSAGDREHEIYPYLLRGVEILRPDQVWSSDITYIPMRRGFVYLVVVMDWFSRYVLSWEVSITMDVHF